MLLQSESAAAAAEVSDPTARMGSPLELAEVIQLVRTVQVMKEARQRLADLAIAQEGVASMLCRFFHPCRDVSRAF